MRHLLTSLLLTLATTSISAQTLQEEIETPRKLSLPEPTLALTIDEPIDWPPPYPIPDPYPYPYPLDLTSVFIGAFMDDCGERRHENGNLKSRCECDDKKRKHGKSAFWTEQGTLSRIEYYSHGRLYTQYSYREDGGYEINRYTYKNGNRQLHGNQVELDGETKMITPYRYDTIQGAQIFYRNGTKSRSSLYKDGIKIKEEHWNQEGTLVRQEFYNEKSQKTGRWFELNLRDSTTTYRYYENGQIQKNERIKNGIRIQLLKFTDGELTKSQQFYDNGNRQYEMNAGSDKAKEHKHWTADGTLINHYFMKDNSVVKNGFYRISEIAYHYQEVINSDGSKHLLVYKVANGDTLQQGYHQRNLDFQRNGIHINQFVRENGKSVRQGKWRMYKNNKIMYEASYNRGILNGPFVLYDTSASESRPYLRGMFRIGAPYGKWEYWDQDSRIALNYTSPNLDGNYKLYTREADTVWLSTGVMSVTPQKHREIREKLIPTASFDVVNGQVNGKFNTFHSNGSGYWHMEFNAEGRTGVWTKSNENGERILYGQFKNNELQKSWMKRIVNKRGKVKWKREKEAVTPPKIEVSNYLQHFQTSDLFLPINLP